VSPSLGELIAQSTQLVGGLFNLLFSTIQTVAELQHKSRHMTESDQGEIFKLQKKVKELTNENMKLQL
jgi:hypothetical protein